MFDMETLLNLTSSNTNDNFANEQNQGIVQLIIKVCF